MRTYDKMRIIEREQEERERIKRESGEGVGGVSGSGRKRLVIRRTTPHHEAAMVSCAKLGLWREAIRIYEEITGRRNHSRDEDALQLKAAVGVTENLVLALVRACVRGSKVKGRVVEEEPTVDDRRAPLDKARGVLLSLQKEHGMLLEPRHVNPLAAAYQSLGLRSDAEALLCETLEDAFVQKKRELDIIEKAVGKEGTALYFDESEDTGIMDRGSYSLMVRGAVAEEDWAGAVSALTNMTEAGLYPEGRELNSWTEASKGRGERRGRNKRSWKRRRDEYWLEGLQ